MNIKIHSSICEIPANQWDALVRGNYPFLKHAFLSALEKQKCVGGHVGWIPSHLACTKNGSLVGALPLYEKHNSWGEFVFDHAWADAYARYGIDYFPKLVNSIPFTPASGQRILLSNENAGEIANKLVAGAKRLAIKENYSGIHCLFPAAEDFKILNQQNAVSRNDCQFHWYNQGYASFDDFLSALKSKKRKNIRQERRKVADANVKIRRLDGYSASEKDWNDFVRLYRQIYDRKFGMPAFNQQFFMDVAQSMPNQVQLVLASQNQKCVAGALMYCDDSTLYGRHWGCQQYVDCLHFEICYYQGIDLCIEKGLQRFDPGAQGEHKIARGFVPTCTRSLHWMTESPFIEAIEQFVSREQAGVKRYINAVNAHSPYNSTTQLC